MADDPNPNGSDVFVRDLATGAAKTWVTKEHPVRAALELAGLGILACVIGLVLGWVVGVAV